MDGLSVESSKHPPLKAQNEKTISVDLKVTGQGISVAFQRCDQCGTSSLVPSGSCYVCYNCGSSQGCS